MFIGLIVFAIILGVVAALVPMDGLIKKLIIAVAVILIVLAILGLLGLLPLDLDRPRIIERRQERRVKVFDPALSLPFQFFSVTPQHLFNSAAEFI